MVLESALAVLTTAALATALLAAARQRRRALSVALARSVNGYAVLMAQAHQPAPPRRDSFDCGVTSAAQQRRPARYLRPEAR